MKEKKNTQLRKKIEATTVTWKQEVKKSSKQNHSVLVEELYPESDELVEESEELCFLFFVLLGFLVFFFLFLLCLLEKPTCSFSVKILFSIESSSFTFLRALLSSSNCKILPLQSTFSCLRRSFSICRELSCNTCSFKFSFSAAQSFHCMLIFAASFCSLEIFPASFFWISWHIASMLESFLFIASRQTFSAGFFFVFWNRPRWTLEQGAMEQWFCSWWSWKK